MDDELLLNKAIEIHSIIIFVRTVFHENNIIHKLYNDHKVSHCIIILPKTRAYVKIYDKQTTWTYLLIKDVDLLEKYNKIWDKVSSDIKNKFNS